MGARSQATSDAPTPALSASGLGLGLGLGLGNNDLHDTNMLDGLDVSSLVARDAEEERLQRTAAIVSGLGTRWGRVSQEGIERCVQRLGLECLWEDGGSAALAVENKERTLSIAGTGLLVDIKWNGDTVKDVTLEFPGAGEWAERSASEGAQILKADLGFGLASNQYVLLDKFSENLARLARTDQLGREGVSCFKAIEGIHGCLRRIWEWELSKVKDGERTTDQENAEREVLCNRSGRPRIHAHGKIGLRLDYWMTGKHLPLGNRSKTDLVSQNSATFDPQVTEPSNVWSLLIECEASSADLYPSIRISDNWVSEAVEQPMLMDENMFPPDASAIDWQDPPPTCLPPSEHQTNEMDIDSGLMQAPPAQFPNVRFVARLEPPVTLPLQTAIDIFNLVGSPILQDSVQSTTYTFLMLQAPKFRVSVPDSMHEETLQYPRAVSMWDSNGTHSSALYQFNVQSQHQSWARTIHEIPFSHPRQLSIILPLLRQWAFTGHLLQGTLGLLPPSPTLPGSGRESRPAIRTKSSQTDLRPSSPASDTSSDSDSDAESLRAPRGTPSDTPRWRRLTVDLILSISALPSIELVFSIPASPYPFTHLHFTIGSNAHITLMDTGTDADETTYESDGGSRRGKTAIVRAIGIAEDLGTIVRWLSVRAEQETNS